MEHPPGTHPGKRPRRRVDWELVICGLRGHAIVGRDAEHVRPEDAVVVREGPGSRWHRCLRCDGWLALHPPEAPASPHPPDRDDIVVPLRGRALRDRVVLRLIAFDRVLHFLVLVLLGIVVLLIANNETSVKQSFYRVVTDLQGGVGGSPVQNQHVGIVGDFNKLFSLDSGSLRAVGVAIILFGVLEGVEAVGLWYAKRWAEYLTFLATVILLPLEVYELTEKISPLKLVGFLINLAVAVYLIYAKRLFGLRGGGAVEEHERAEAISWATIEAHTPPAPSIAP